MIILRKLAHQQKEQRALKIKNKILKQTHDVKLAESLSPITKKLNEVNQSTQKVGDITKESNSKIDLKSLPNSSKVGNSMRQMLGSLMNSRNSLKITRDESSRATILGIPNQISADTIKINENIQELTPEIYKALTYPTYDGRTMKNENDIFLTNNNIRDVGYTGDGDKPSKRKKFLTITLPKLVEKYQKKTFDYITNDSDDLQGEGVKINIPSNINDMYTTLEILLGLKLSGRTDTLTEASILTDDL